jgi:hypothetical protein
MVFFTSTSSTSSLTLLGNNSNYLDCSQFIVIISTNCIPFDSSVIHPYIETIYQSILPIPIRNNNNVITIRISIAYHYMHDLNLYTEHIINFLSEELDIPMEKLAVVVEEYW